jgi:hypothetical protein
MGQWDSGDDWLRRSLGACSNKTMADILNDNRGPDIHSRASAGPAPKAKGQQSEEPQDRSGWRDPVPLRNPPGIDLIDGMVSAQDERDRLARIREAAEIAALKKAEAEFLKTKAQEEQQPREQKGKGK